jgi:hypothetical protein
MWIPRYRGSNGAVLGCNEGRGNPPTLAQAVGGEVELMAQEVPQALVREGLLGTALRAVHRLARTPRQEVQHAGELEQARHEITCEAPAAGTYRRNSSIAWVPAYLSTHAPL